MQKNPFSYVDPVREVDMFVGRQGERDTIRVQPRSTLFIGEAKSGKTSLLLQLREELEGLCVHGSRVCPVYVSVKTYPAADAAAIFRVILTHLVRFASNDLSGKLSIPTAETPTADNVIHALQELDAAREHVIVALLADDLDEVGSHRDSGPSLCQALRNLIDASPPGARVIVIAASTTAFLSSEDSLLNSPLLSRLDPHYLLPLSLDETRQLMRKAEQADSGKEISIPDHVIDLVHERTGGNPYLVQKTMYHAFGQICEKSLSVTEAINEVVPTLASSNPAFQVWTESLNLKEMSYLLATAMRLPVDGWQLGLTSLQRFVSMGVIYLEQFEDTFRSVPMCGSFYDWIREQANDFVQLSTGHAYTVTDVVSLAALLNRSLPRAVGAHAPKDERRLQDCIQSILAAYAVEFKREHASGQIAGKGFRADFVLPDLGIALEAKLVNSGDRISKMVDDILADVIPYTSCYRHVLFLIYDTTGKVEPDQMAQCSDRYNVRFAVIQHAHDRAGC